MPAKNLVGTVTQPAHVAIAPQALRSLPRRDVVSGYGEMLKYGLALDAQLYRALRDGEAALLDDPASALDAIARCVALKAEIVAHDEEDRTGTRAVLNFGHTVGHAIEKVAGYGALRHGEAVIVGMRAALALSAARGALDERARADADAHLAALPVPDAWRGLDAAAVVEATARDKKRHAGGTQFVLLDAIGTARLHDGIAPDDVRAALARDRPGVNVLVVNGPNLNLLGIREPHLYGRSTLRDLEREVRAHAKKLGMRVRFFQSNHEGEIIDELHRNRTWANAIVLNPAAFTHYSYAIRDAILAVAIPTAEVHLTDVDNRPEPFRKISVVRDVCAFCFKGAGIGSYLQALDAFASMRDAAKTP